MQIIDLGGEWTLRQSDKKEYIKASVNGKKDNILITLTVKTPALWAWLELDGIDARLSDNFFHIIPGKPVRVAVSTEKDVSLSEIKNGFTSTA
jgi:beta-mannosidase